MPSLRSEIEKSGGCCLPIIVGGIILLIIFYIMGSNGNSGGVITDDRTYSESWRSPYGTEYSEIGKIIVQNGIKVCGEYYVKEVETNEYIIACSADGTAWDYFVVYKSLGKIYRANYEMESKLYPPR